MKKNATGLTFKTLRNRPIKTGGHCTKIRQSKHAWKTQLYIGAQSTKGGQKLFFSHHKVHQKIDISILTWFIYLINYRLFKIVYFRGNRNVKDQNDMREQMYES